MRAALDFGQLHDLQGDAVVGRRLRRTLARVALIDIGEVHAVSAERLPVLEVAHQSGVSRTSVWRWQQRYAEEGVDSLLRDKTRPPGKPPHSTSTVAEVLALTCSEPPDEVTH